MSSHTRNDDASELQEEEAAEEEAAEEEELQNLEREIEGMAETILKYRTNLPDHLTSTLSSILASQRPDLPTHLADEVSDPETRMLTGPDPEAGASQGPVRENMALSVSEDPEEAEKIQLLKQKISSNASTLPVILNRMKEYMARIDKLESSNGTIHPVFKRKRTS
ncbi:hypothetical protein BUALT_Bualt19G0010100 [Buddleja alternifolia]|uniref:Uncharacterized protein n=1 Tax=Buddleja alternifolia TaxID=168488 RepID=A0AAV6W4A3_9LAMI|nr:hypothetical protein BUALT_Bualt19G0010100 [Buddleja alternifolia]